MIDARFVFLGAAISLFGSSIYARRTLRGLTKPNRVTWLLWFLVPIIIAGVQLANGVGFSVVMTLSVAAGPLLIFTVSLVNDSAYWHVGRFDFACGAAAIGALALWTQSHDPVVVVCLAIAADLAAGIPTLLKAFRFPETESPEAYFCGFINGSITILSLQRWDWISVLFPGYILLLTATLFCLIHFSLGRRILGGAPLG